MSPVQDGYTCIRDILASVLHSRRKWRYAIHLFLHWWLHLLTKIQRWYCVTTCTVHLNLMCTFSALQLSGRAASWHWMHFLTVSLTHGYGNRMVTITSGPLPKNTHKPFLKEDLVVALRWMETDFVMQQAVFNCCVTATSTIWFRK